MQTATVTLTVTDDAGARIESEATVHAESPDRAAILAALGILGASDPAVVIALLRAVQDSRREFEKKLDRWAKNPPIRNYQARGRDERFARESITRLQGLAKTLEIGRQASLDDWKARVGIRVS